ncbi:MAG: hypothetical protein QNK04_11530 [Myxococcota bacterium]|nr:hypothetical protein [Myxococcota bacterium]
MADAPRPSQTSSNLDARLEQLGRSLGERESAHRAALEAARKCAFELREQVAAALDRFHDAAAEAGAPHLRIDVSEVRADDKHLRAVEFDLQRGRYKAIVTAKSRGEVTLVGPFRLGKVEGPCLSFPFDAKAELGAALEDFLARFLEEAATP